MRRITILLFLVAVAIGQINAQQDPMFTKYMFNSLVFNPAYAGSKDHMSFNLLHRTQWLGIEGAPLTQTFTGHTPLENNRVGVGLSVVNDRIGVTNNLGLMASYAYRMPIGKGKLSIGLQGGIDNWNSSWSLLKLQNEVDEVFIADENKWLPNFGAGLYYYTSHFYVGASVPRILENTLTDTHKDGEVRVAKQYRHSYFMVGTAIPLSGNDLIFKPSLLVKNVGLLSGVSKTELLEQVKAPTEFDIDMSLLFSNTLWVGAAFRSSFERFTVDRTSTFDSFDLWVSYLLNNGLSIGVAYDYTLTKLNQSTGGSFEISIGYEFDYHTRNAVTPRYF